MTEEEEQRLLMTEGAYREVAGEDGEIDAFELRRLLNQTFTPSIQSPKIYILGILQEIVLHRFVQFSVVYLCGMINNVFISEFEFSGFSVDLCRSMVAMKDVFLPQKLSYLSRQSQHDIWQYILDLIDFRLLPLE